MQATTSTVSEPNSKTFGLMLMTILGALVGVIAGYGAVVFRYMIGFVHNVLFLKKFTFTYISTIHTPINIWGPWVILVPVLGSVIVSWLVSTFATEAKGHGVPEVMYAIHHVKGRIRPVVAIVKSLASAISIGSGGSVGREGPIVQIGAAFGSTLASTLRMLPRQATVLVAAGAGAGIAATFNAPLGGLAFAIELMLVRVNAFTILPVAIACVVGTYISHVYFGAVPAFDIPGLLHGMRGALNLGQLCLFIPFGLLIGTASLLFVHGIYWFEDKFDAMPGNYYTRHALGMLCMGVLIYLLGRYTGHFYVNGVGYSTIMDTLTNLISNPGFLFLLFLCKFLATGLTLGSGASGGVFSPALFLGATLGSAFGLMANHMFPGFHVNPVVFALAGMAGMVCGTTGALLTAIFMTLEMTHTYQAVLPLVMTATIAYGFRKRYSHESIYTLKLSRRGKALPEGLGSAVMEARLARNMMLTTFDLINSVADLNHWAEKQKAERSDQIAVVQNRGEVVGVIMPKVFHAAQLEENADVASLMDKNFVTVSEYMNFTDVIRAMLAKSAEVAIVSRSPRLSKKVMVTGVITEPKKAVDRVMHDMVNF